MMFGRGEAEVSWEGAWTQRRAIRSETPLDLGFSIFTDRNLLYSGATAEVGVLGGGVKTGSIDREI
jgi:hypothetical protein